MPRDLSKKTVEEVWKDIQHNNTNGAQERRDNNNSNNNNKQATLGEMTLEDLLLKAGVVTETVTGGNGLGRTTYLRLLVRGFSIISFRR